MPAELLGGAGELAGQTPEIPVKGVHKESRSLDWFLNPFRWGNIPLRQTYRICAAGLAMPRDEAKFGTVRDREDLTGLNALDRFKEGVREWQVAVFQILGRNNLGKCCLLREHELIIREEDAVRRLAEKQRHAPEAIDRHRDLRRGVIETEEGEQPPGNLTQRAREGWIAMETSQEYFEILQRTQRRGRLAIEVPLEKQCETLVLREVKPSEWVLGPFKDGGRSVPAENVLRGLPSLSMSLTKDGDSTYGERHH